jgi:hypothetical protein
MLPKTASNPTMVTVAGMFLLFSRGFAPWDKGEAKAAAAWAMNDWIKIHGGMGSSEAKRQIAQVRELIDRRRFDGFASPSKSPDGAIPVDQCTIHDCVGYSVGAGEAQQWWFTVEQWKSACKGYDSDKETLTRRGY